MARTSNILQAQSSPDNGHPPRIRQLYRNVELFSEGTPPVNSLFILGRPLLNQVDPAHDGEDELLLVDPPSDLVDRFRIDGKAAVVFTRVDGEIGLPRVQTMAGGVAHIRIGEQFVDIYAQEFGAIVHLSALGVLCGGDFGSGDTLPTVSAGSDGEVELDTLRLLAGLVKKRRIQLYIPRVGEIADSPVQMLERLAADVAYLHNLRRVIPPIALRSEPIEPTGPVAQSLLPADRRNETCRRRHADNLDAIYRSTSPQ